MTKIYERAAAPWESLPTAKMLGFLIRPTPNALDLLASRLTGSSLWVLITVFTGVICLAVIAIGPLLRRPDTVSSRTTDTFRV